MTKREGAILSAYTGRLLTQFSDFHEYVEEILERPIFTHELASKVIMEEIKDKSTEDFMAVIKNQS